ncbi:tRNA-uridine aminocarboxypropyltransferase [Pontibacter sp. JAM-7]|uniref:tRNA-uridine aminocarboxypropyltransferase n=1 Tax=Pontibacter sp. JAM-7 TaxID=3366581 RepID=UPI003AF670D2
MTTPVLNKPFIARGSRTHRCPECLLAIRVCICSYRTSAQGDASFVLLMHHNESFKPTNTGRLIADCFPDTKIFEWSRTQPPLTFLALLNDTSYQPYLVFPAGPGYEDRMVQYPATQKRPLFILLDGTWRQARRMFRLSKYLQHLPVITLPQTARTSRYHLRQSATPEQLCTAEIAAELLHLIGDHTAGDLLMAYFDVFNEHYRAARLTRPLQAEMPAKQFILGLQTVASGLQHKGDRSVIDQTDLHVCTKPACCNSRV